MYRIQVDLLLILTNTKVMVEYGRPVFRDYQLIPYSNSGDVLLRREC